MTKKLCFALWFFSIPGFVSALEIREAFVAIDQPEDQSKQCFLYKQSNISAVETVLRQNKISISSKTQNTPYFYVNINVGALEGIDGCVASASLSVRYLAQVPITFKSNTQSVFSNVELCQKGVLLWGESTGLQTRISNRLREMTEICINEIHKMNEKSTK